MATENTRGRRLLSPAALAFLAVLIVGLLAHSYLFNNKIFTGLDEWLVSERGTYLWAAAQGRWFQVALDKLSGDYSMPLVNGLFSLVYYGFAAVFIIKTLKIEKRLPALLVSVLLVTTPMVSLAFLYTSYADLFAGGMALACLAVWLTLRYRYGFLFGALALMLSLATYQAFISVAAALAALALLMEHLRGASLKRLGLLSLNFIAMAAIGLVLYLVSIRLTARYVIPLTDYQNISKIGAFSLSALPRNLLYALALPLAFYTTLGYQTGIYRYLAPPLFCLAVGLGLVLMFAVLKKRGNKGRYPVAAALLLIFDLMCGTFFLLGAQSYHPLVAWGVTLVPIAPAAVLSAANGAGGRLSLAATRLMAGALLALALGNVILGNALYLHQQLAFETASSFAAVLQGDIVKCEGYSPDMQVIVFGEVKLRDNPIVLPKGFNGLMVNSDAEGKMLIGFLNSYGWVSNKFISASDRWGAIPEEVKAQVSEMPAYPAKGSVAVVNGEVFVQLIIDN